MLHLSLGCHRVRPSKKAESCVERAGKHSLPALLAVRLWHPLTSKGMSNGYIAQTGDDSGDRGAIVDFTPRGVYNEGKTATGVLAVRGKP